MRFRPLLPALVLALCAPLFAQDIKVSYIASKSGPLEAYGKQNEEGFRMGLDYATLGTMKVNGRAIQVIYKDDQGKPERARALMSEAYRDDKADLVVGGTLSATALLMVQVALEEKKVFIIDVAAAHQITGEKYNRYVFRVGRTTEHEAIASALGAAKPGTNFGVLAQDYAFGRDSTAAFKKAAIRAGATVVHEELAPLTTTDFTAPTQRLINALKDKKGEKVVWVQWVGPTPVGKVYAMNVSQYGIKLNAAGTLLSSMKSYKEVPNLEGTMSYYYTFVNSPVNSWLIKETQARYKMVPDSGHVTGFMAAQAAVKALQTAGTDTEKLIAALEGMTLDTPKGSITIRKEDHQAIQSMFQVRYETQPNVEWAVPVLVREVTAKEIDLPISNGK